MTNTKNPHETNSPEWQLYENMLSLEAQARAYAQDAERYTSLAASCRTKAQRYSEALKKLEVIK